MCLNTYQLDPSYFLTLAGFAWKACLKMKGVELELLTDLNMILMIEEGIRGGICQVSHAYIEANNKYMDDHDKNKRSLFLVHVDANNLHGCPMTEKLPVCGFK